MSRRDWSREEVEATVDDHLSMLASELASTPYNKAAHRRLLKPRLAGRSDQSIEFKHANISAVLLEAGFPYIDGYKPRPNYQALLAEVLADRMQHAGRLHEIAAADADRPMPVPEVENILAVLTERPKPRSELDRVARSAPPAVRLTTNYIEREARNRSMGTAGELFVMSYEQARLIHAGHDALAAKVEHTSRVRGDYAGYDILSFEENGAELLIEVKTTKYGSETPFFVSRNEVSTSERESARYCVYRLFAFRTAPRLYTLSGAISHNCILSAASFLAQPR